MNVVAGPCSFESKEQTFEVISFLNKLGIKDIRGGINKYRSDKNTYQGNSAVLGWIKEAKRIYDFKYYAEVFDIMDVINFDDVVDVYQVGSRNMYNTTLLKNININRKPVILKRHYCASLQELVKHAEYLDGCEVTLCLRGKQSLFPQEQRFCHDFADIDILKKMTNLPIMYDVSHSSCWSYRVKNAIKGAMVYEPNSIMIELHPDPPNALSDPDQQLNFDEFKSIYREILSE